MKNSNTDILPNLALLLVAIIWGSGFIGTQLALDAHLSSACIMFGRFAIATLIIGLVCWKDIKRNIKVEHIKGGVLIGLFLFLGFYVQTVGLEYTTPSNNAFITATNVVIVPFLWWAISKQRPSGKIFVSSFLCLVGIGILSLNLAEGFSFGIGDLLTLSCAFFFACQIVATGKLAAIMEPKVLIFLQFFVATILSLIVFLVTDGDFTAFSNPKGMLAIAYLGIFSTCICYFLQTTAQQKVPSAKAAVILATESLFGTVFSVMLGYDKISPNMIVGGFIILVAILMTEIKFSKNKNKKNNNNNNNLFEEIIEPEFLFDENKNNKK